MIQISGRDFSCEPAMSVSLAGAISSSPKWREKRMRSSSLTFCCPRKRRTLWSYQACSTASNSASLKGFDRSRPRISAPSAAPVGITSTVISPLPVLPEPPARRPALHHLQGPVPPRSSASPEEGLPQRQEHPPPPSQNRYVIQCSHTTGRC